MKLRVPSLSIVRNWTKLILCLVTMSAGIALQAQMTVTGRVLDAETGETLVGANVMVEGAQTGVATGLNGRFTIEEVPKGATLVASMIGYETVRQPAAKGMTIELRPGALNLSTLEIVANRSDRETPFAYTNIDKKQITNELASRDLPLVLNTSPSVYATNQGGGAGDARINVRGFNQRNVAIMINGVPVNDMENGWVYWSNWDGLGDAAQSIQVQRGLSSVNLATPSIGGTINIVTDPAGQQEGGYVKQEYGSWNFKKTSVSLNSGLINDKWAFSGNLVRKSGDGFAQGTFIDAWAYYFGASFQAGKNDRLELYVIGAPQRHGQNLYKQNIGRYSHDFARSFEDYDEAALDQYVEGGRHFNQNYNQVDPRYDGLQYWSMYSERDGVERYGQNYLMERENFYHKPQINLNWYHTFNEKLNWATIAYWSGGAGGGTGTYGSVSADYGTYGQMQWDDEIAENSSNIDSTYSTDLNKSTGILRNSRNNQWTIGAISKLYYDVNDAIETVVGVDWRTAEIEHYREVRDLLGGDYFVYTGNDFDQTPASQMKMLGDKIAYNFTNTVDWLGGYAQATYEKDALSAFAMVGVNTIGYTYTNHFYNAEADNDPETEANGNGELYSQVKGLTGFQVKGGLMYEVVDNVSLFANGGYVSKTPIFDGVMNDQTGIVYENPVNETFLSFEGGAEARFFDRQLNAKASYYYTKWQDRTQTMGIRTEGGEDAFIYITGMDALHSGLEMEVAFQPVREFRIDGAASFANWYLTDDVSGTYQTWEQDSLGNDIQVQEEYNYYVKDLKIGDAPQTQLALSGSVFPTPGFMLKLNYRYYANHYAAWDPFSRTDESDRIQSWKAPSYGVLDFHGKYTLPFETDAFKVEVFVHVFNLLDNVFVQDAVDNSQFNAFDNDHDADDAEVFLGMPRNFNAGFTMRF